jgi:trigger factor
MNVSVTDISPSQKKIRVEIPASKVSKEIDGKYRDLAKRVKIKGFRPGKVPRSIMQSYYGKAVEQEISSEFIQETFPEALKETDLKPLTQADVSDTHFEDNGSFSYTALVDICPPFELPNYKGLEIYRPPVDITEEQVDAELEKLRQNQAQLRAVEGDRPIREGDVAIVDFTPIVEGKVFEKGKMTDYMAEIGKGSLHPDFDKHVLGHRPGESFSFELDYAEDAPNTEIAGKRVHFELTVKELKEKEVPELNDEFALSIGSGQFETIDALKQEIRNGLSSRAQESASGMVREQITEKILQQVDFEISPRVVDHETNRMVDNLKYQFESQGIQFDSARFNTPEFRTGYRLQAEKNIRSRLVLARIAEIEQVQVTQEDDEAIYNEIARAYRMDPQKVKREYSDSALVEQARERKLEDRVFSLIEAEAVYVDKPEAIAGSEVPAQPEAGAEEESGAAEQEN